jgi:alkylhydroperoxidase/carboxymuconolactone decarboxylase family protein YurZ
VTDSENGSRYAQGRDAFARIWGDEATTRFEGNIRDVSPDLLNFIMEFAFGDVWSRGELDSKTRSLITIAVLGTLGRSRQLGEHVEGALNNGASEAEVLETLLHLSAYAGLPAAWDSIEMARRIFRTRHKRPSRIPAT